MGWSGRQQGKRFRMVPNLCSQPGCKRVVAVTSYTQCEHCWGFFCLEHLLAVSQESARVQLCKKCALDREAAVMPTQPLYPGR